MRMTPLEAKRAQHARKSAASLILEAEESLKAALGFIGVAADVDPAREDQEVATAVQDALGAIEAPCRILRLGR